ncbi:hypothetical protein H5410_020055 [Solanum commersonii]|uniref:Uncharacterized protein n=1 Tax=Solanum commersonii TaxID=4109 RepID=A0A9J5ZD10_SOLCO|nr:hypothetical protein H5410_020055 [Solanum commersonii]
MNVAKIRILRWTRVYFRRNRIENEVIGDKVRVVYVVDRMRHVRLRRFVHVKRRCMDTLARRYERLAIVSIMRGGAYREHDRRYEDIKLRIRA